MFHGLYIKNKPKSKWHLVSVFFSVENAQKEAATALKQAKSEGFEQAETAIQIFDSSFHIPEYLTSIKDQKLLLN